MNKKIWRAAAALIATSFALPATAVTVTFADQGVASGTDLTTQYASQGITLYNAEQYQSVFDFFDQQGVIQDSLDTLAGVIFTNAASNLSIDYLALTNSGTTFLEVRNEQLALLGSFSITPAGFVSDSYSFSASNIKYLTFRSTGSRSAFGLSTLRFDATDTGVAAVPEPATWALMIAGFGFVGGVMRQRKVSIALA